MANNALLTTPSNKDIRRFVEVVVILDEFEANQRLLRGHGAFPSGMVMPIPEVQRVMAWLRELADV